MSAAVEAAKALRTCPAEDRWFHLDAIKRRVAALTDDEPTFGLVPSERTELAFLRTVLTKEQSL